MLAADIQGVEGNCLFLITSEHFGLTAEHLLFESLNYFLSIQWRRVRRRFSLGPP